LKNQFYTEQAKKINKNAANREMQQLFSNARNPELAFQKRKRNQIMPQQKHSLFQKRFNPQLPTSIPDEIENILDHIQTLQQHDIKCHWNSEVGQIKLRYIS